MRKQKCVTDDGQTTYHEEQPSRVWEPMVRRHAQSIGTELGIVWGNLWYDAFVVTYQDGWFLDPSLPWARIGLSHVTQKAVHDWRDIQRIKNDIVGPEWSAVELYPPESMLRDPSNRFYLWCAPQIPIGWQEGRVVCDPSETNVPQRPFGQ